MFSQTSSKLLLVLGIALCLYSTESSAETVCHNWWKTLPAGSRKMTVKLMKRANQPVGRINSGKSTPQGAKWIPSAPQGGACPGPYDTKDNGACLWAGLNVNEPTKKGLQSGWVTGSNTKNCGAAIFANKGNRHVKATVVDVCLFNENGRKLSIAEGCSTMYVTRAMYVALGGKFVAGKPDEVVIDNWDFVKEPF